MQIWHNTSTEWLISDHQEVLIEYKSGTDSQQRHGEGNSSLPALPVHHSILQPFAPSEIGKHGWAY